MVKIVETFKNDTTTLSDRLISPLVELQRLGEETSELYAVDEAILNVNRRLVHAKGLGLRLEQWKQSLPADVYKNGIVLAQYTDS